MGASLLNGSIEDQMYRPPGYLAADPNAVAGPSEYTLQQYAQPYAPQYATQQYAPPQMFADPGAINDSTVNAALAVLNRAPISRPMPAMRGSGAIGQPDQTPYGEYLRTWGNIAPEVSTATQVNQTPAYSGGDSGSFGGGGVGNVTDEKSKYSDFLSTPFGELVALGVNAISPGEARTGLAPVVDMSKPYSFNPPAVPSGSAPVVSSFTFMGGTAEEAARGMDAGSSTPGNVNFTGPMAPSAPVSSYAAPGPGGGYFGGSNAGDGGRGSGKVGYDAGDMGHGDSGGSSPGGGCVIATAAVASGNFTKREKQKAVVWCVKTLHSKWWGESIRRGYRFYGNRAIAAGKAHEYYDEFRDFIRFATGTKRNTKTAKIFIWRSAQFFVTGLFVKGN